MTAENLWPFASNMSLWRSEISGPSSKEYGVSAVAPVPSDSALGGVCVVSDMGVSTPVVDEGDRSGPTGSGARDLHGKAGEDEPVSGQPVEVGEPFDLAVFAIAPREVRRPKDRLVPRLLVAAQD